MQKLFQDISREKIFWYKEKSSLVLNHFRRRPEKSWSGRATWNLLSLSFRTDLRDWYLQEKLITKQFRRELHQGVCLLFESIGNANSTEKFKQGYTALMLKKNTIRPWPCWRKLWILLIAKKHLLRGDIPSTLGKITLKLFNISNALRKLPLIVR